ncbi:MAG TPA: hypothetical protein VKD72_13570 [Gemmataceae bacterium]|nr:hypothetical protein [Gemmataceae bacterium]
MSTSSAPRSQSTSIEGLHAVFLTLLPRILLRGEIVFRHTKCPHQKEEFLCEMLALTWKWLLRLTEHGKDPLQFPTAIADFAARAVKAGRRLCGKHKGKDVLNPLAQQRHDFVVELLPSSTCRSHESRYSVPLGQRTQDVLEERLQDNRQTPVPEQVVFRLDFPAWVGSRSERDRRVIDDLLQGERTLDVADKHGLSPGRVSQLRREFMASWEQFCAEKE